MECPSKKTAPGPGKQTALGHLPWHQLQTLCQLGKKRSKRIKGLESTVTVPGYTPRTKTGGVQPDKVCSILVVYNYNH